MRWARTPCRRPGHDDRAIHTNGPPAGAFRGFGVPQAAIAHEALLDDLAAQLGIDQLEIRLRNALRAGSTTATGQVLAASAGLPACLEALEPRWVALRAEAQAFNGQAERAGDPLRRGVGIGAMWYGIGNTSLPNPSTVEIGVARDGTSVLFSRRDGHRAGLRHRPRPDRRRRPRDAGRGPRDHRAATPI